MCNLSVFNVLPILTSHCNVLVVCNGYIMSHEPEKYYFGNIFLTTFLSLYSPTSLPSVTTKPSNDHHPETPN